MRISVFVSAIIAFSESAMARPFAIDGNTIIYFKRVGQDEVFFALLNADGSDVFWVRQFNQGRGYDLFAAESRNATHVVASHSLKSSGTVVINTDTSPFSLMDAGGGTSGDISYEGQSDMVPMNGMTLHGFETPRAKFTFVQGDDWLETAKTGAAFQSCKGGLQTVDRNMTSVTMRDPYRRWTILADATTGTILSRASEDCGWQVYDNIIASTMNPSLTNLVLA